MMRHFTGRLETGAMVKTLAKLFVAGALLAGICSLVWIFFFSAYPHATIWANLIVMLGTIACGAGVFFGTAYLLHVAEVRDVVDLVRRRLGSANQPSA
jgi:Na+/melibiose symporter-like transporter